MIVVAGPWMNLVFCQSRRLVSVAMKAVAAFSLGAF